MQDRVFSQPNSQFGSPNKVTISVSTNAANQIRKNTNNINSPSFGNNCQISNGFIPISGQFLSADGFTSNSRHFPNANAFAPNSQDFPNANAFTPNSRTKIFFFF